MDSAQLTAKGCLTRVDRLRGVLDEQALNCAVFEDPREILYFTGAWLKGSFPAALLVPRDREPLLVRNAGGPTALIGQAADYVGQDMCTALRRARRPLLDPLQQELPGGRAGVSKEHGSQAMADAIADKSGETVDLDDQLFAMQQFKDADEVAMLRAAIAANEAGYEAVRRNLRPGLTELEVFEIAHAAICNAAGAVVDYAGDFQCGEPGGPARPRPVPEGELYIVDSFPTLNGYWSDMSRTFAVGEPTAEQRSAHEKVAEALAMVEATVKPGLRTADLFERLTQALSGLPFDVNVMPHHAGHGIGLRAHEWPSLWPHAEHTFQPGHVFTCEPGVYGECLRAGVRLEETFLVTETGAEKLTKFPLTLQ